MSKKRAARKPGKTKKLRAQQSSRASGGTAPHLSAITPEPPQIDAILSPSRETRWYPWKGLKRLDEVIMLSERDLSTSQTTKADEKQLRWAIRQAIQYVEQRKLAGQETVPKDIRDELFGSPLTGDESNDGYATDQDLQKLIDDHKKIRESDLSKELIAKAWGLSPSTTMRYIKGRTKSED